MKLKLFIRLVIPMLLSTMTLLSCTENESITPTNENESNIIPDEEIQVVLSHNYLEKAKTFLFSNGVALSISEDSIGDGYYLFLDSLDLNTGEWVEEKAMAIYCDSTYKPILATNSSNDVIQFFYSENNTFSLTFTKENNESMNFTNIPIPENKRTRASTNNEINIYNLNKGFSILSYGLDLLGNDTRGIVMDMLLSKVVPEGIPQDLASLSINTVVACIEKAALGYAGLALNYAQLISDLRYWVVKQEIGDITPTISLLTLSDENSVNVRINFNGSGFTSPTKDTPLYHVKYWKEMNGSKVGQSYATHSDVAKYGFTTETISNLSGGTYAFQVFVYPSAYNTSDFLMNVYSFHSDVMYIEIPSLHLSGLEQEEILYDENAATVYMKVKVDYPSAQDEIVLSYFSDYGIYVKNGDEEPYLYTIKGSLNTESYIMFDIPKKDFTLNYNTYTAIADDIKFGTYTIDNWGITKYYDEQIKEIIYDKEPSVRLMNLVQGATVPYSDEEGRDVETYYSFECEVSGALFVDDLFVYNTSGFEELGKFSSNTIILDGIYNCNNWSVAYHSSYPDSAPGHGYKYIGISVNGKDILANNYIEVNWETGSIWLAGNSRSSIYDQSNNGKYKGINHIGTIEISNSWQKRTKNENKKLLPINKSYQ